VLPGVGVIYHQAGEIGPGHWSHETRG